MSTLYLTKNDGSLEIIQDVCDVKVYSSTQYTQGRVYFWLKEDKTKTGYQRFNSWSFRSLRNISKVEFDL